jgi:hypothetical protein
MTGHILPIDNTRRSGGKGEICKTIGQGHRSDKYEDRLSLAFRIKSRVVCTKSCTVFCVVNLQLLFCL